METSKSHWSWNAPVEEIRVVPFWNDLIIVFLSSLVKSYPVCNLCRQRKDQGFKESCFELQLTYSFSTETRGTQISISPFRGKTMKGTQLIGSISSQTNNSFVQRYLKMIFNNKGWSISFTINKVTIAATVSSPSFYEFFNLQSHFWSKRKFNKGNNILPH